MRRKSTGLYDSDTPAGGFTGRLHFKKGTVEPKPPYGRKFLKEAVFDKRVPFLKFRLGRRCQGLRALCFFFSPALLVRYNRPYKAPVTTTTHGGSFQCSSMINKIAATAKSSGARMVLVQIGSYRAASKIPTTAAFTPTSIP